MQILIIEDEFNLADIISNRLKKEKYTVEIVTDGDDGLFNALTGVYDLAILDIMLPNVDGFEILKKMREEKVDTKVIMLTAKAEIDDKLSGFNYEADDYITKPFHIEELVARVNVQLGKNSAKNMTDYIEVGSLKLHLKTSSLECTRTNEMIEISCKEFLILEYLMQHKGMILSKSQIYDRIWGTDNDLESNSLEAYLSFIRKKLKVLDANVSIRAVRGLGYKLEVNNE